MAELENKINGCSLLPFRTVMSVNGELTPYRLLIFISRDKSGIEDKSDFLYQTQPKPSCYLHRLISTESTDKHCQRLHLRLWKTTEEQNSSGLVKAAPHEPTRRAVASARPESPSGRLLRYTDPPDGRPEVGPLGYKTLLLSGRATAIVGRCYMFCRCAF